MFVPFCRNKWIFFFLAVVSACFVLLLILLGIYLFPGVIDQQIDKNMRLDNDNDQWERFKNLPFPIIFKIYMFNVTNPKEVETKGAKPNLVEVGPYVYRQNRRKSNLSYDNAEDTVSYYQHEAFTFDKEASGTLSDRDNITTLNVAAWAVITDQEDNFFSQMGVSACLNKIFPLEAYPSFFMSLPVHKLLFDGMQFCKNPTGVCPVVCNIIKTRKNIDGNPNKEHFDSLRFSYFNYKNNTPDGRYTVNRGRKHIDNLGKITMWNNTHYTNFWNQTFKDLTCDHVKGTDSTLYPPRITKQDVFSIYSTDICRSVDIYYSKQENYKGIDGYVFATKNTTLRSQDPEYDCYCTKKVKNPQGQPDCYLDGIIDVSTCIGAPILLSFPHFLWADKKYLDGVNMTPPDESKHHTFLHVEPNTGVPLRGTKRVQLNVAVRPVKRISATDKFPRTVLPLLWLDEGFELPQKYVDELNKLYFDKVKLVDWVKYGLIALFALLTAVFGVIFIRLACCDKKFATA